MTLKLDELPPDLQPLARLINRFHAMSMLVHKRTAKTVLLELYEKILADLETLQSTHPSLPKILSQTKGRAPDVIAWMKPANELRQALALALQQKEAAGEWVAAEVDLRLHQADGVPAE
ncbi:hypothetical protein [Nannocystis punicea]|uniref:Uncharacterized protein n=1 Tax=Nannocystis punicea TaxID=2995304 RepID=A0ABY7HC41_9BACT|nr:hypothetical protein [Nannocystis poenicansa]WAS96677.1 hypothetical protein O0S08_11045 [Nannocystis poenicansa]